MTMIIGITGHQRLEDPSRWDWVGKSFRDLMSKHCPPFIGFTSLAEGTDQLLANEILQMGGEIHAIIPYEEYEHAFQNERALGEYRRLLNESKTVETLQKLKDEEESFLAAGKRVVDSSELIVAVWDGKAAKGLGGTGDVVKYAKSKGKIVIQLDPCRSTIRKL